MAEENQNLAPPYMPKEKQKKKPQPKPKKEDIGDIKSELFSQMNNVITRLRIVDEKYQETQRKINLTDETQLKNTKKLKSEIKALNDEVNDLRDEISELKEDTKLIVSELKKTAMSEQVEVLKKYLDLWEPINFVTKEQLKRVIKDLKEEMHNN